MSRVRLHDLDFVPFIPEEEVAAAIDRVASRLNADYAGKRPLLIGVLNGAFFFAAELVKRLSIECEVTFVKVASYHGTRSTGKVSELIGLSERVEGRHVVVLEDIVDTGSTIRYIMDALAEHHPASVRIAALLFKPDAYKQEIPIDFVALNIPSAFVVGSGLDHDGLGRNLPGILKIAEP
ncbi:MAG: hypoxanthine phosphoribosyltransferase [Flavobacteriales bacterium]|jgi:hypoxanthine phosphoribosyltransferase|nr:hypoxanthine phosphoribosyltransferase [Flavobacteriales bacterium]